MSTSTTFQSLRSWNPARPRILVVACSDGRLQVNLDEFLQHRGVAHYDRLYAPGGPGALASSGIEYARSDSFRRECLFFVEAHQVEEVYLIFHGPSPAGPDEAVCADYRRLFPRLSAEEVRAQQMRDLHEIVGGGFGWQRQVQVHAWSCEVGPEGSIVFTPLRVAPRV